MSYTTYPQASSRKWTSDLWQNCKVRAIRDGFGDGWYFEDDFTELHDLTGKYTATQAGAAGTFAIINDDAASGLTDGGVAAADCASSTVTQGINVQAASTVGARFRPQAGSKIFFEARIAVADLTAGTTGPQFFCGLSEIDPTIIATSAISSANHVGFGSITDDGVLLGNAEKATAAHTGVSMLELGTAATLANVTWHKLGFVIDGTTSATFWVDGVEKSSKKVATANVPIVAMVPSLVCQSDGTVDPITYIDWWACYQQKST